MSAQTAAELVDRIAAEALDVLAEIVAERARQDAKFGDQSHLPDGTGVAVYWGLGHVPAGYARGSARRACQQAAQRGVVTWLDILREEVAEAFAESDPAKLRTELVQLAAVAVQWVQAIDRRAAADRAEGGQR